MITKPQYREDKATQAASLLLKMSGGEMNYLKLMKLLYLADRRALIRRGRPIVYDSYVSMDHGMVLSETLDLMRRKIPGKFWDSAISAPIEYKVALLGDCGTNKISRAEERLIAEIFSEYGHLSEWELRELTHRLPEYKDPKGSSISVEYEEVLKAGGRTIDEINSIIEEIEVAELMDQAMKS